MKTLNYVELSDFPCSDEIYDELKGGIFDITLSPSRPTLLDISDFNDFRSNPLFDSFFEKLDTLRLLDSNFKIMVYG